jgi:hypothetical protein
MQIKVDTPHELGHVSHILHNLPCIVNRSTMVCNLIEITEHDMSATLQVEKQSPCTWVQKQSWVTVMLPRHQSVISWVLLKCA